MTQARERVDVPAALERAEQVMKRAGYQLGILAGRVTLRMQQTTRTMRAEKERANGTGGSERPHPEAGTNGQAQQPATARAEDLVDQLGQRASRWAKISVLQARRAAARLQEEAEDMWVEAHETRDEWREKREKE